MVLKLLFISFCFFLHVDVYTVIILKLAISGCSPAVSHSLYLSILILIRKSQFRCVKVFDHQLCARFVYCFQLTNSYPQNRKWQRNPEIMWKYSCSFLFKITDTTIYEEMRPYHFLPHVTVSKVCFLFSHWFWQDLKRKNMFSQLSIESTFTYIRIYSRWQTTVRKT